MQSGGAPFGGGGSGVAAAVDDGNHRRPHDVASDCALEPHRMCLMLTLPLLLKPLLSPPEMDAAPIMKFAIESIFRPLRLRIFLFFLFFPSRFSSNFTFSIYMPLLSLYIISYNFNIWFILINARCNLLLAVSSSIV